ncbi:unnamed protein product [Tetraodon nigroviridis]|uniref:(spotted green pufferfish) hypothetical protein n=1 Tax=Tetraodon nigroviridis TaxID=99883 RepID=Q4RU72_TETNG|nr:unnamed protein product [Tetraodon nigroviridis]
MSQFDYPPTKGTTWSAVPQSGPEMPGFLEQINSQVENDCYEWAGLVPDSRSELSDPEPRTWSGVCGAVLSPGAEADTFSGISLRGDSDAHFEPRATVRL